MVYESSEKTKCIYSIQANQKKKKIDSRIKKKIIQIEIYKINLLMPIEKWSQKKETDFDQTTL